jgi:hypothetical protein
MCREFHYGLALLMKQSIDFRFLELTSNGRGHKVVLLYDFCVFFGSSARAQSYLLGSNQ